MAESSELPFSVRVHERGDAALDGILRLIDEAARPRPLPEVLAALCAEVGSIMGCPVVSIYLRARDAQGESLQMAANVGFPSGAASRVRLGLGEGIVGSVAEALRPVSLVLASTHGSFRHFPELGEERFPVFLAVPLLVGRRTEGVLVLQRAQGEFDAMEVALATALGTSFAYALERARVRRSELSPSKESRRARLEGTMLSAGVAIGRVETLPTFEGLAARWAAREEEESAKGGALSEFRARVIQESLAELVRDLGKVRRRLSGRLEGEPRAALEALALLEEDSRFVDTLVAEATGDNVALRLRKVARDYAAAPYRSGAGAAADWLRERAEEVEALCLLLASRCVGERVPTGGAVLVVPDRFGAVIALSAIAHEVAAIAVGGPVPLESTGASLLRAAGVPALGQVGGLFAWARAGDVVMVEADEGLARVNPSAAQIARYRQGERAKRSKGPPEQEGA